MNNSISRFSRRATALALATLLIIPTAFATAGTQKLQTSRTVVDGLEYINTITEHSTGGRTESFALELDPDSDAFPIMVQSSGTIYASATIHKAIQQAQNLGYRVLGAINTDYFSTSTGVPTGISIEDGVYRSGAAGYPVITVTDGVMDVVESAAIPLSLTNQRDGRETTNINFNKFRAATGGIYLLNDDFSSVSTRTTDSGWAVRMKLVKGDAGADLTVNTSLTLEVTEMLLTDQPVSIGEDEYILTASNQSGYTATYESFQLGDTVTLSTSCQNKTISNAQWASGGGDIMIQDGQMTDTSSWIHIKEGRAPRTALGMKKDGTAVLYVADGRKTGYSGGLTQKDLAQELLNQGCEWAINLDGGGSSSMSVLVPGQSAPTLVNSPSDGKARSCATYLLLVTKDQGDGKKHRLVLKDDSLVVLAGASLTLGSTVVLDSASNPLTDQATDVTFSSATGLGSFDGAVYTAGSKAGTDTIILNSKSLDMQDTAQIHVVDSLTALNVTKVDSSTALSSINTKVGEVIALNANGSYWSRAALRDGTSVAWSVTGDAGTITPEGVFTASLTGGSGTIVATAGGISKTIPVSLTNSHTDVPAEHWAYTAVSYCYAHNIVGGISASEFGRDQQISRGDFLLMLYSAAGKPAVTTGADFADVLPTDYYYNAIAWGQANGLASGVGEGNFAPNTPITREQAFTILRQAMPRLAVICDDGPLTVLDSFDDKDLIADYAKPYTSTLVAQGIVSGKGTGIDPRGNLTRAEMAALLYKVLTYTPIATQSDVSISLDRSEMALLSAETVVLSPTLSPEGAVGTITWTSSDPSAVAVSSSGTVTNIFAGVGTPSVTVTATCGGSSATCRITCLPAEVTGTVVGAELGLNVRSGPGTDFPVVHSLKDGLRVVILSTNENGWYRVLFSSSGQAAIGYVSPNYIQLTGA